MYCTNGSLFQIAQRTNTLKIGVVGMTWPFGIVSSILGSPFMLTYWSAGLLYCKRCNLFPVAQQTNTVTTGFVGMAWVFGSVSSILTVPD